MSADRRSVGWAGAAFGYLLRRGWRGNFRRALALGPLGTLRRGRQILQSAFSLRAGALLDKSLAIDTGGQMAVSELGLPPSAEATAFGFGSIPVASLREALRALRAAGDGYTFIDLGCGKGRALAIAAEMGFKHLIGVEHSPTLARIARTNAEALASRFPTASLQILEQNAATYDPPPSPCLVFFYTPFPAAVLCEVLSRIEANLVGRKTPIILLFARQRVDEGPHIETAVDDFTCFRPMPFKWPRSVPSAFPQIDFAAFRADPVVDRQMRLGDLAETWRG